MATQTALLQIRLPEEEKARLKDFCGPRDMSTIVRTALSRYLDSQQGTCARCGKTAWIVGYRPETDGSRSPLCADCF